MTKAQIEASKLARGFGAALERVVKGETIEVIRYGRVVAVLAPPPKERREPRTVQPEKLGAAAPTSLDAVSPGAQVPGNRGKITRTTTAAERQAAIDDLLRGSRRGPNGD